MYFSVMMIMCTISLVMTVIVLNLHHRNPDTHLMPKWVSMQSCDKNFKYFRSLCADCSGEEDRV